MASVNWFEIYVQDMARAKAFYESVLDIQLTELEGTDLEMFAFPMHQDSAGALVKIPSFPSGNNSVLIYFSCADCAVEAKRAADAGRKIETQKRSVGPYGYIAHVIDTEGNLIGLHSIT